MLLDASIIDSQLITDSDHWIVRCIVNTSELISEMTKQQEEKAFERLIFEYDKAEPKHWDRFTKLADELFLESDLRKIWDNDLIDAQTKSDMLWLVYQSSIRAAAETHLPYKMINNKRKEVNTRKKQIIPHHYFSALKTIRTLLRICCNNFGKEPTVDKILRYTKKYQLLIPHVRQPKISQVCQRNGTPNGTTVC